MNGSVETFWSVGPVPFTVSEYDVVCVADAPEPVTVADREVVGRHSPGQRDVVVQRVRRVARVVVVLAGQSQGVGVVGGQRLRDLLPAGARVHADLGQHGRAVKDYTIEDVPLGLVDPTIAA
ncbi:hypothetical protein GCM10009839_41480 [Catenulispora yoronensis]|uniref:Uncharacterized protein n=1 Tax=Catenulispora yoronensis TaxID=450799 RepID=A0ABP5FXR6_9ACTN